MAWLSALTSQRIRSQTARAGALDGMLDFAALHCLETEFLHPPQRPLQLKAKPDAQNDEVLAVVRGPCGDRDVLRSLHTTGG